MRAGEKGVSAWTTIQRCVRCAHDRLAKILLLNLPTQALAYVVCERSQDPATVTPKPTLTHQPRKQSSRAAGQVAAYRLDLPDAVGVHDLDAEAGRRDHQALLDLQTPSWLSRQPPRGHSKQ